MKKFFQILLFTLAGSSAFAQCDTVSISNAGWSVISFSSQEASGEGANNGRAIHCFDNDLTTYWHSQWQGSAPNYPHEIVLDLGAVYPLNGFDYTSRIQNADGKVWDFEFSTSLDNASWTLQSNGKINYPNPNGVQQTGKVRFGAVSGRYIKLHALSSTNGNKWLVCAELKVFQDQSCGATGQLNQQLVLDPITKKMTTEAPFDAIATVSSGQPISYSIVSGPASISGNQITLTGAAGLVTIKAEQTGDATYYATSATQSFEVVDVTTIYPTVRSKLTEARDLQMPSLYAYKLYANATILEPTLLSISSMAFEIDGIEYPASLVNGSYEYWWTPSSFGPHTVKVRATGTNGNVTDSVLNINVTQTIADQTVSTFDGNVINFDGSGASQWFYGNYTLPQSVGAYDSIQAKLYVTCPSVSGGCDDWDRVAWIQYKAPDGDWHELIRYVTPYGKACNHSIDVTDYASLLQGNIEIRMYIETWGTGGWKLDLDFQYFTGMPDYLYSTISEVWHGTYNFGQIGNLQPVPVKTVSFPAGTVESKLRLHTTGHGWGANNTGNAAEFYNATHNLLVDGVNTYTQTLWTDCNPNPDGCTNQSGTWQYDRAGWCPGSIAKPYKYDLSPLISGGNFDLKYQFKTTYQDMCNPANPSCVSGTTCDDCNAGYNPHYVVSAYAIHFSQSTLGLKEETSIKNDSELKLNISPNPSNGIFQAYLSTEIGACVANVIGIDGTTVKTFFFNSVNELNHYQFNVENLPAGIYFLKVNSNERSVFERIVLN